MKKSKPTAAGFGLGKIMPIAMTIASLSLGCHKTPPIDDKDLRDFKVVNLVANKAEYHPRYIDPTLINAFGMAWEPGGLVFVNSVGGHVNVAYTSDGERLGDIKIPSPKYPVGGLPCGVVANSIPDFFIPGGPAPASFIFSGFDGVLSAWLVGDNAQRIKSTAGGSYTGLTLASIKGHGYLYAANFGQKKIDVWDGDFHKVDMPFKDPTIPYGYSPYNIQAVGDYLFVMYAQLATAADPDPGHGVAGPGKGFVNVFSTDGKLISRFASRGTLNVPWGVTAAPASFLENKDLSGGEGGHGGYVSKSTGAGSQNGHDPKDSVILIGNFGDGHINVFKEDGHFLGQLRSHDRVLEIEGLWALSFPPATADLDPGKLYFTAGPDKEADGVLGYLKKF